MPNPVRYAILDHAGDDAMLCHLPWSLEMNTGGTPVEIHPRRSIDEVRPHLIDLLREGHLEMYRLDEPDGPRLTLDEALAAVADDANWNPPLVTAYGLITTESGDREYEVERQAAEHER